MPKSPKLAKEQLNFRQGLQNLDLHECGFVCADIHANITVYQPALSVDPDFPLAKLLEQMHKNSPPRYLEGLSLCSPRGYSMICKLLIINHGL